MRRLVIENFLWVETKMNDWRQSRERGFWGESRERIRAWKERDVFLFLTEKKELEEEKEKEIHISLLLSRPFNRCRKNRAFFFVKKEDRQRQELRIVVLLILLWDEEWRTVSHCWSKKKRRRKDSLFFLFYEERMVQPSKEEGEGARLHSSVERKDSKTKNRLFLLSLLSSMK